jgi:hypothetical protein
MDKLELKSIIPFVERSVIPIVTTPIYEQRAGTSGTGSIFNFNGRHFLISASHVFDEFDKYPEFVGIPTGRRGEPIYNFGQCDFFRINNDTDRNKYDTIIIEIPQELAGKIAGAYSILNIDNIAYNFKNRFDLVVVGYPFINSIDIIEENGVYADPFRLTTFLKESSGKEDAIFDPKVHMLLDYEEVSKEQAAPQELRGLSGSPIWCYNPDSEGVWSPEKNLKTVGIVLAVKESLYIRGISWFYVTEMFKEIDADIYNLLTCGNQY